jgi:subtilisin-like proprotein convertase family protein
MMHVTRLHTVALLGGFLLTACPPPTGTETATDTDTDTDAESTGTTSDPTTTTPTTTTPTTTEPTSSTTDPMETSSTTVDPSSTTDMGSTGDPSTSSTTDEPSTGSSTGEPLLTLCDRLGGPDGVAELITGAFGVVLVDDKVNGYFLNNDVDATNLGTCLIKQVGELAQCEGVVYDCLDMKTAHAGLGISANDFMDFAVDFSAALDAHQVNHPTLMDADKTGILDALGAMAPDIVEDADNNLTVYQRVGRKPAIRGLVGKPGEAGSFVDNVANDAAINGFFGATDFDRLNTCLTRQVAGIDGPTVYGGEVDAPPPADPGVGVGIECKDMATVHTGLVDANDNIGIDINDFGALVTDLVTAMNTAGVAQPDQDAILGVLGPMCGDVLAPQFKNQCPGSTKDETVEATGLNAAIPDDSYTGALASMFCQDIVIPDDPIDLVANVEVTVALSHTWIGDVTVKVSDPLGQIVTLASRPGLAEATDDGEDCCGDSSNLDKGFPLIFKDGAANDAEQLGAAIAQTSQIACKDDGINPCEWNPNPGSGPGMALADFVGVKASGTWKVCVGDSGIGDLGTVDSVKVVMQRVKFNPKP